MNKPEIIEVSELETPLLEKRSILLSKDFDNSHKKFIRGLYNNKEMADVILICHEEEFYCHKVLLQQYPFFRELFEKYDTSDIIRHDVSHLVASPGLLRSLLIYTYLGVLNSPRNGEEFPLLNASRALTFHDAAKRIRSWMGTFLSPEDAIEILEYAFKKKHRYLYSVLVRRIGPYGELIFENNLHFNFSKENLKYLLENGELWVSELKLFHAVVRWCKNQVNIIDISKKDIGGKQQKEDVSTTKKTYQEYFTYFADSIRYPLMGIRDFATHVEPSGLISEDVIYRTYRYFSTPEDMQDLIFGEKYFVRKLLRGYNILRFRFSAENSASCVKISDEGREVGLTSSASRTIVGDTVISYPSVYYFEFKFMKSTLTSYTMFGIGKPENPAKTAYLGNSPVGYAIYACNGNKYHSSKSVQYHKKFDAKTKPCSVGVLLNLLCNPTKMFFYVDGKFLGLAFEGIELPVVPAVSVANVADVVRISDNPKLPSTWRSDITKK